MGKPPPKKLFSRSKKPVFNPNCQPWKCIDESLAVLASTIWMFLDVEADSSLDTRVIGTYLHMHKCKGVLKFSGQCYDKLYFISC